MNYDDYMNTTRRIAQAETFLNLLYKKITAKHFSYLMTFSNGYPTTYPFAISDKTQLAEMAKKAIELSDNGSDIWHAVNPVSASPTSGKRGDETAVSYQIAIVVDIDIRSDAHKSDNLATNFDEAKSFLPFTPSLIIDSGYGLHAYYIFNTPIEITNQNREELKRRNNLLIDVVRQKANGKKIDGVGDLPRILRTPGTYNYKLGRENAPLCHIVEINEIRFSLAELDAKLSALHVEKTSEPKSAQLLDFDYYDDNPELREFRIRRMLDYISVVDGEYEKWLSVGMALKNENFDCSLWENWSRTQPDFKEGECEAKWLGFDRTGYAIGTLYKYAIDGGYDESETRLEWKRLHSYTHEKKDYSLIEKLKAELRSVAKALADFDSEKNSALELLRNVDKFDADTIFDEKILKAAAFAKLFDKKTFSSFKAEITSRNQNTKEKKVSVLDWLSAVKDKVADISSHKKDLSSRRNELNAQIQSLSFIADNDLLHDFYIPESYSISAKEGVIKIDGDKIIQVSRCPVIIKAKSFNLDDKKFKKVLAYMSSDGKWTTLAPVSASIIANKNKIVDLADSGLPVTSSTANHLVDFLDAFHAVNENFFPMNYTVPRCGWYRFNDTDYFVDPRHFCYTHNADKKISVVVDEISQFAQSLKHAGSLKLWKKIYKLAKKSPVARLVVAASVAPPLLKILGERNFLLYICAPTRAGKTTALYLGASAVGNDKMIRSFDATKNGLAGAAADVNDYPFLIDEKQVADNRLKEAFDTLVYALANGLGRTKLNKDSTLRKLTDWRTIAVMTGETQLLSDNVTGGANTRLLNIDFPREILSADDCKQIRNTIKENFGLAFPLFLNKIFEVGFKKLNELYNELVDDFTKTHPELLNEYCRYMAVLTLADSLLNLALSEQDTQAELPLFLDDAKLNATEIFKLVPTIIEISDVNREKAFVLGFIAQNQNRFQGGNVELDKMQTICGKLDDPKFIYITVLALKEACAKEGFDYKKLVADLIADGFFVPNDKTEKGHKTPLGFVQKKIGKVNTNCYRISHRVFEGEE